MIMQAHLLLGPIPSAIDGSGSFSTLTRFNPFLVPTHRFHRRCRQSPQHKWGPAVAVSASSSSRNTFGGQDHYAVLGVAPTSSSADVKRAYRLLALKHHPDVSKHSQSAELFKKIRCAYEVLSNAATRAQYDQSIRLQQNAGRSYRRNYYYGSDFVDDQKAYRWAKMRQKMQEERRRYWESHNVNEDHSSHSETEEDGENLDDEKGPFIEVLKYTFMSLFLLNTFGSQLSLAVSSIVAMFDRKLDAGYKIGHLIACLLGGREGIFLTLCLQFASWACGKTSSSLVALVVVALWVGSNVARFSPIPQGALLTLLYMSMKLHFDLN